MSVAKCCALGPLPTPHAIVEGHIDGLQDLQNGFPKACFPKEASSWLFQGPVFLLKVTKDDEHASSLINLICLEDSLKVQALESADAIWLQGGAKWLWSIFNVDFSCSTCCTAWKPQNEHIPCSCDEATLALEHVKIDHINQV